MKKVFTILLAWLACGAARATDALPDFKLVDANPFSPRSGQQVSPRDYLLQVSGFYFGASH